MMKQTIILLLTLASALSADYIEVKTSEGKAAIIVNSAPKLYVCYDKRVKIISDGNIYLRYDGCARYRYSCKSNDKARFGKYPTVSAAKRALYRCKTAQPKFID